MTTVVRRLLDLTVEEHTLTVPLVWGDPADSRTIDVFAAVVSRPGGETRSECREMLVPSGSSRLRSLAHRRTRR